MEIVSAEELFKIRKENKSDYMTQSHFKFNSKHFKEGDIIHTIDYHYLEDEYGNDINQDIIYVNPNVIEGEYRVERESETPFDFYCILIRDCFGRSGTTAYVGKNVIFENYD